mgnify:FL=1
MTGIECLFKLAALYKVPVKIEVPNPHNPEEGIKVFDPQIEAVGLWLKQFPEGEEMKRIYAEISRKYIPTHNNPFPLPAHLEKIIRKNPEDTAELAWIELGRLSHSYSLLCVDLVVQEVIKSFGGWDRFTLYRMDEPEWCHKDFIKRFSSLAGNRGGYVPEILLGWRDEENGTIDYDHLQICGDRQVAQEMIDEIKTQNTLIGDLAGKVFKYVNHKDAVMKHCKGVAKRYPLETAGGKHKILS